MLVPLAFAENITKLGVLPPNKDVGKDTVMVPVSVPENTFCLLIKRIAPDRVTGTVPDAKLFAFRLVSAEPLPLGASTSVPITRPKFVLA